MSELKLGCLPAKRPVGLSDLGTYAVGKLPSPPKSAHYGHLVTNFPMFGNDVHGDCVKAGEAHLVQVFDAEVKEADTIPTEDAVVAEYFEETGGADSGLVEADALHKWYTVGCWGNKLAGYAPVNPRNLIEVHQAVAFYGGAMLGVALPQSAQEQFGSNEPWTVEPGSPILGGHCIDLVGYDAQYLYAVTWGKTVAITYPWFASYVSECWALLSQEFAEAGHGPVPAIDFKSLQADLSRI